jgi:putative chitinase
MSVFLLPEHIQQLAPVCRPEYWSAFERAGLALARFGIDTSLRMAHFMAQVMHESGALTMLYEDLDYSAARLPVVWPTRFRPHGPLDPKDYAHDPRKLANSVYAGRLGNTDPDDGFRFRGRGMLQLTGKDSYARATTSLCRQGVAPPDFTRDPDAILLPAWAVPVAASHWHAAGCNEAADCNDVVAVARLLNGGAVGMKERMAWYRRTRAIWS